jgi:HD-like signal output (HDOD) protein
MQSRVRGSNYGQGVVTLDNPELEYDALRLRLLKALRSPTYEPPVLPQAVFRLLELSRKADVKIPELVTVIEQDPLIAGKVLRVAQSPVYSRGAPLQSLHDAVVRLGLETLLQIFLEVSVSVKVFRAPGYDEPMERLRIHSSATAQIARIVCRYTSIYDEYAFLCGLLHDVGIAACMIALAPQNRGDISPPFAAAWPAILELHEEASRLVCASWKLPSDVQLVVGNHELAMVGKHVHPVAAAVRVADWLAQREGFGLYEDHVEGPPERIMAAINLSIPQLQPIIEAARAATARLAKPRPAAGADAHRA